MYFEKRSQGSREYAFYEGKSKDPCTAYEDLLPKLLGLHENAKAFTIYTEFVTHEFHAYAQCASSEELADRIFRVAEIKPLPGMSESKSKNAFTPELRERLIQCAETQRLMDYPRVRTNIETILASWDRVAGMSPTGPLVLSHGDLHIGNLRTAVGRDETLTLKIVDWEMVGIDYVGADLDVLFSKQIGLAGFCAPRFWKRYLERTSEAFRVPPASVRLAGDLRGAEIRLKRALRFKAKRFHNLNTVAELMRRAQQA